MYIKTMENRKDLIKRIEQLTGLHAVYTRMPECAFEIGAFKVERDGTLVLTAEASKEVVDTLLEEGLIKEAGSENDDAQQPVGIRISVPISGHTVTSLRNLLAIISSRGKLISKATGGCFACPAELVESLKTVNDIPAFLSTVESYRGALQGLAIEEDRITFTGFPETSDPEYVRTFTQLTSLMNKMAMELKHILPRTVSTQNEKYAFRIWLIRLGMGGDEYRTARRILLSPLDGSSAFRDEAMKKRWKENRKKPSGSI